MTFIITSPEDVVNLALVRIGFNLRIGSLYEGSIASKKALDVYSQTRDELLRSKDWGFAERNISMTLLKQAPPFGYIPPNVWNTSNPSLPWFFEYEYPDDCLKVRSIRQSPIFVINYDPEPIEFSIENDNYYVPAKKVILCNVPNAILTYTGQVTNPTTWEPDFVEVLVSVIGRTLAPSLARGGGGKMAEGVKMSGIDDASVAAQTGTERG